MSKSQSTKRQEYTYSLKTVALTNAGACRDKFLFWLAPPQDAISIQYLRTHFVFQFDSGVAVADRVIEKIGIISKFDYTETDAAYFRALDLNLAADGNREVDIDINLSSLLKKDNVAFTSDPLGVSGSEEGYTLIYIKLPVSLELTGTVGTIKLWKADGLFTTKGIR